MNSTTGISAMPVPMSPGGLDLSAYANQGRPNNARAVEAAATAFESVFVSLLMKELRQTSSEGSMFGSDKGDVLGGMFDHYLGQHLASSGALGIASMVKKSWSMRDNHGYQQQPAAATSGTNTLSIRR